MVGSRLIPSCLLVVACGGATREEKTRPVDGGGGAATGGARTGGEMATAGRPPAGGAPAEGGTAGATSAGGASTGGLDGGSATGGAYDAGAASGGVNATGGSVATGGAAPVAPAMCRQDSDCIVFEDCCSCEPASKSAPPAGCPAECNAPLACTRDGAERPNAKCSAGRCTFDRYCSAHTVTCKVAAPDCAAGTAPEVLAQCYTGKCIPAEHCLGVDSCEVCDRAGLVCASFEAWGALTHCVRKPPGCDAATCECMNICGGSACGVDSSGRIGCYCLGC